MFCKLKNNIVKTEKSNYNEKRKVVSDEKNKSLYL